ncbi:undecaprenyl/decaprenyl-phosphate alpha-N-acetylglucosaminyl 1-phosphate transferase [Arachidicoccus soli]|uniref:Undecaprenyl/decaprenyl-phosphate alpha-N-acetylglucosaminyl 1-phosphate transferase n=2 Tax=Arachidicoccus soli TaxID=2341117 RepID=A0A386HTE3_9BACT|nr:undecaprenyl/decaprenyl-phosphate alpha-N-acetylglucosaminyl 1-phosphate transferase [Arachidicoccus soli]
MDSFRNLSAHFLVCLEVILILILNATLFSLNNHMKYLDLYHYSTLIYAAMFILAMGITVFAIPSIIFVAKKKKLLDKPDHRKKHLNVTPNLGGIALFSAFVFVNCIFHVDSYFEGWCYILAGAFLLFVTGLKDDLVSIDPYKKFIAQIIAAVIVVYLAGIRLTNLEGFLGIHQLPYLISFAISVIGITFVTNAFNLIDGVDGLAGGLSLLLFAFLGFMFAWSNHIGFAMICFTIAGAVIGFLKFNIAPAKIFMGDTGSLIIGFLASVLSIAFVTRVGIKSNTGFLSQLSPESGNISIALAAIIVPVYDTFRVFTTRILRGYSPFRPDRTHVHHVLLDIGLTSTQVTATLFSVTAIFIALAIGLCYLQVGATIAIFSIIAIASILMYTAIKIRNKKLAEKERKSIQENERRTLQTPDEYISNVLNNAPNTVYEDKVFS